MVSLEYLSNGIQVVLEEISYVRSISFGIWVKNGSRYETPENNGISHYIEHMLFKGTENRTAKEIAEEMDAVGGQINAYTTKEYTCYHTRVLDKHFDRALDVMSDMFLFSRFDQRDIDKERNVIIEEIDMYEDAPEELVHDALQEAIWKDCSLGMPILGTKKSISSFTTTTLKEYFGANYHQQNTVISVAGNIQKQKILEKLEKAFGSWNTKGMAKPYDTPTVYTPSVLNRVKEVEQVHACLAFPGIQRDHRLKYPLAVFNTIFGGGMSSRLFQKIREEHGLTYSIYSYTSAYNDAGLFSIYAGMNPGQTEEVMQLIFGEIRGLKEQKISKKMLEVTKEQIISNYIIGTESTSNRMTSAGASMLLRGSVQSTEEVLENIESITDGDLEEVQNLIFDKSQMSICLVGNTKEINAKQILENSSL